MAYNILIFNGHPFYRSELKGDTHLSHLALNLYESSNKEEVLTMVKKYSINLVIIVYRTPGLSVYLTVLKIIRHCPLVKVLVDSRYDEELLILSLIREGIHGYILDTDMKVGLAIRCVLSGRFYFSRELEPMIIKAQKDLKNFDPIRLNDQECKLLELIAAGKSSNAIARELSLTKFTIDTYRKQLIKRFKVSNSCQLIHVAHKAGII
jgi:DNA-binding NarL/FixJ family response regulator